MRRVLKWTVPVDDQTHMIGNGKVLHVACQAGYDSVQVWTEELDESSKIARPVRVYGTGQPLDGARMHIGSALTQGGHLVWHLYEVGQ